jgi:hypothetical protein
MSTLVFNGVVEFRSSLPNASGPPGETAVLALNPQRIAAIREITGWDRLQPGSLNLSVDDAAVGHLKSLKPTWTEPGSSVRYPPNYAHIPRLRGAYLYYLGNVAVRDKTQEVLIRTAANGIANRVELFAPDSLVMRFGLSAGDLVTVTVPASP